MPIVTPPPGADVYLAALSFQWYPILRLQKDAEYTLHLSSLDVNHGFSLYPINVNFQVVPGYDYGLRVTPNASGDFRIICNEFCGIGHHIDGRPRHRRGRAGRRRHVRSAPDDHRTSAPMRAARPRRRSGPARQPAAASTSAPSA